MIATTDYHFHSYSVLSYLLVIMNLITTNLSMGSLMLMLLPIVD